MPPPLPSATVSGPPPYEQNGPPLVYQYYGLFAAQTAVNNYLDPVNGSGWLPYKQGYATAFLPSQFYYMTEEEAAIMYQADYLDELVALTSTFMYAGSQNEGSNEFVAYRMKLWDMKQAYKSTVQPIWDRMRKLGKLQVTYDPLMAH